MMRCRGLPRLCQAPTAILIATSTAVEPVSEKNTCVRPWGACFEKFRGNLLRRSVREAGEYHLFQLLSLFLDCLHDSRVAMAVGDHPPRRNRVDDRPAIVGRTDKRLPRAASNISAALSACWVKGCQIADFTLLRAPIRNPHAEIRP